MQDVKLALNGSLAYEIVVDRGEGSQLRVRAHSFDGLILEPAQI